MLEAVVALLAVAVAVNLLLTWAMVRRLRQLQGQVLVQPAPDDGPRVGDRLPEGPLTTASGTQVVLSDVVGAGSLVAFLSPGCSSCIDELPTLRRTAEDRRPPEGPVVVVVDGRPQESGVILDALDGAAPVLFADRGTTSFLDDLEVHSFPALCVVDAERTVTHVPPTLHALSATA